MAFDQSQIDGARYGYQKQTYTWGPDNLAVGSTTIFTVQNWNKGADIQKICILEGLAATQNANVQLYWTYDEYQSDPSQGWTDSFPSGFRWYPTKAIASSRLQLVANNLTGAPIADFQINYVVGVISLFAAQRMLLSYQLTKEDRAAFADIAKTQANIENDVNKYMAEGKMPISWERTYDALFANRRVSNPAMAVPFHLTIPVGATVSNARTISVPPGVVHVIRGIAMEGASGITLSIDRDNDLSYINAVNGAAFVHADDAPWEFFVPYKDHIAVSVSGAPGTYPVRVDVDAYVASDLMLQHLLMETPGSKVQVGLL